jgi:hypothetical protein
MSHLVKIAEIAESCFDTTLIGVGDAGEL